MTEAASAALASPVPFSSRRDRYKSPVENSPRLATARYRALIRMNSAPPSVLPVKSPMSCLPMLAPEDWRTAGTPIPAMSLSTPASGRDVSRVGRTMGYLRQIIRKQTTALTASAITMAQATPATPSPQYFTKM